MIPTPTYIPPGEVPPLELGDNMRLWNAAPEMVGLWNQFREYTPVFQWIIVILCLVGVVFILIFLINKLRVNDDE